MNEYRIRANQLMILIGISAIIKIVAPNPDEKALACIKSLHDYINDENIEVMALQKEHEGHTTQ